LEAAMPKKWVYARELFERLRVLVTASTRRDVRNSQLMGDSGWSFLETSPDAEPEKVSGALPPSLTVAKNFRN
jgi:hypothetical protein